MPFNGDEFSRLGLPPYSGALAAEFQNLADGLTTLKGSGGGVKGEANPSGAAIRFDNPNRQDRRHHLQHFRYAG